MRTAFIDALLALAEHDERIHLLCGDIGYSVLEPFRERFAERFLNVGVAEQNMIGIAAGLAADGRVPFCYSIGNFPTLRCLEQIRNDVCYHGFNVNIAAVGGGLAYGAQGYTHHAIEDLAILRALPRMVVAAPGDPLEAAAATRLLARQPGPSYLRLGRAGEKVLHRAPPPLAIGRAVPLDAGADGDAESDARVLLLSTGAMLDTALTVRESLRQDGIAARAASMPFLKPFDAAFVRAAARRVECIATVEEHAAIGGLGQATADCLARMAAPRARLVPFAIPEGSTHGVAGGQDWLRARAGLDADSIAGGIKRALRAEREQPGGSRHAATAAH